MDSLKINKVQLRNLQIEDYEQLAQSFTRVYTDGSDVFWTHKQIEKLIRIFPEGQIVTVVDEKIVGCALSIIVNYDDVKNDHTYAQVTGVFSIVVDSYWTVTVWSLYSTATV